MNEAAANGLTEALVSTEVCCGISPQPACITTMFNGLRAAGTLSMVKILYPVDEPETKGMSDAQVSGVVDTFRQLAAGYPELSGVRLGVVYGPSGPTPGLGSYDLVGRDNYGHGPDLSIPLSTGQFRIILPGGADPWREDPASFVQAILDNAEIALLWVFTDLDRYDGVHWGVLNNGMFLPYCKAGLQVTGKQGVCNG